MPRAGHSRWRGLVPQPLTPALIYFCPLLLSSYTHDDTATNTCRRQSRASGGRSSEKFNSPDLHESLTCASFYVTPICQDVLFGSSSGAVPRTASSARLPLVSVARAPGPPFRVSQFRFFAHVLIDRCSKVVPYLCAFLFGGFCHVTCWAGF